MSLCPGGRLYFKHNERAGAASDDWHLFTDQPHSAQHVQSSECCGEINSLYSCHLRVAIILPILASPSLIVAWFGKGTEMRLHFNYISSAGFCLNYRTERLSRLCSTVTGVLPRALVRCAPVCGLLSEVVIGHASHWEPGVVGMEYCLCGFLEHGFSYFQKGKWGN